MHETKFIIYEENVSNWRRQWRDIDVFNTDGVFDKNIVIKTNITIDDVLNIYIVITNLRQTFAS